MPLEACGEDHFDIAVIELNLQKLGRDLGETPILSLDHNERDWMSSREISLTVVKGKNGCFSQISPQLLQVEFNYCNVEMVLAVGFEGHLENINQLEQAALWTGDTQRRKILVWAKSVPCSDQKAS